MDFSLISLLAMFGQAYGVRTLTATKAGRDFGKLRLWVIFGDRRNPRQTRHYLHYGDQHAA